MEWFIRLFFKTIRAILGPVLLLSDMLTTPRGLKRAPHQQQQIDAEARQLVLYQFRTCPFCIKVRRALKRLSLDIEMRDALRNKTHRTALLEGGGQIKVPCLRITDNNGEDRWLYESDEIVQYLQSRFT